ncbi:MAG: amidohydrolase family protein, partial [Deltaproteobacteria bacterium]|nr:amidohydrolase family protein [Deltaproteobacteria bacterium]
MIIDSHTHIFPVEIRDKREDFFDGEAAFKLLYSLPGSKLAGVEELIRNMDNEGVDKSVVFGFPWKTKDYFKRNNDYILNVVERYKDRLIGFSAFFPLAKDAQKELERCLKSGLSGVGELAFYTSAISEDTITAFRPIAEIAQKFDVPILLHTNESVGHYYPGKTPMTLKEIYDFLQYFPDNKIILAHWGGGLFFYYLMKKAVKGVLKNTWFDTAASPYLYDKEIYSISTKIVGLDKILFGSDFPLIKPSRYFKEMKDAGLSKDAIGKICGENAASLLKIG